MAGKAGAPPRAAGPGSRRATSYDVARAAGVSQSAVSRCFADGASIAPATREKILKVATHLGYRPNALAQGLISGRTNLVAVLIARQTTLAYPEVLAALSSELTDHDMRVLLFSLSSESEVDAVLDQVWRHQVDGVISAARLSDEQVGNFADRHVPLVLYNRPSRGSTAASVSCDSVAGERQLVGRLLAAGHRRFGIVAGPADSYVGEERRAAVLDCLAEAGIAGTRVVRGDFRYASGQAALRELVDVGAGAGAKPGETPFDAIVCVNDMMALGVMDAARVELGLSIPEDLSVVGFDGSDPASWASYGLTSIRQPVGRMTRAAVKMLLERIEHQEGSAEHRLFGGELIEGRSARLG